jgi:two-component system, OmpR family, phosphate regulon sensor histidine kinase PhoR
VDGSQKQFDGSRGQLDCDLRRASDFHAVLLAMMAHDLRQPLQVIQGSYERLAHGLDVRAGVEYVRRGTRAVAQVSEQLDLLVDALRHHQRGLNIEPMPLALGPLLIGLYGDHAEIARRKNIELRVLRTSVMILSDTVLLHGILRNLLQNALKFTPEGGCVLVGCRRRGRELRIEVRDTGIGMPPEQVSKAFDAFQRLDSTVADGLGLGLFVVRRAANLLGHRLDVRSALGGGSTFAVIATVASN